MPAVIGRLEFDTFDEGREPEILEHALKLSVLEVWDRYLRGEDFTALIEAFDSGLEVETSDAMGSDEFLRQFPLNDGRISQTVERSASRLRIDGAAPASRAGALEFVLEGLHLNKRINKSGAGRSGGATYSGAR
jgi:magnesium chelatase subunit I